MEWPKLKRDCQGLKVRTARTLKNGMMEIPAGTICEVSEAYSDWVSLSATACERCKVRIFIRKVPRRDVILLEGSDA